MSAWAHSHKGGVSRIPGLAYNGESSVRLRRGWPIVIEPGHDTARKCRTVRNPVSLAHFGGILIEDLSAGDQGLSAVAEEGAAYANLYIPTAAQISGGSMVAAKPGAHLLPLYSGGVGYFVPVPYETGIVLLEDKSASTEGSTLNVLTSAGAKVSIQRPTERGGIDHLFLDSPDAGSATAYHDGLATSAAATTSYVASDLTLATMEFPRNLVVTPTGTAADVAAVDVTITGLDLWGNVISEAFTLTENALTAATGNLAFAAITGVSIPAMDGAGVAIDIGSGVKFGLGRTHSAAPVVIQARSNGAIEGTAPTLAADPDLIAGNTISFNTAPNGSRVLEAWLLGY